MVVSANTFFLLTPPGLFLTCPRPSGDTVFFILKERLDEKQIEAKKPSKIPEKAILNVSFYNINNQIVRTSMS